MSPQVVGLLGIILGGGFVGGISSFIINFRKSGPETAAIATETLIKVNEELRLEIKRLSDEVERLRSTMEKREPLL